MGDPKGFLKTKRQSSVYRPVCERVSDFREVALARTPGEPGRQVYGLRYAFLPLGLPCGKLYTGMERYGIRGKMERGL